MLSGTGLLVQDEREAVLQPGDLAVYDTSRPYSLVFGADFRTMIVMFPRQLVALPPEMMAELTAVRISGHEGVGAIIVPYLTQLAANLEQLSGVTGARLTQSAMDPVTTLFTHELDLDTTPNDPHRALMHRIFHAHIDRHLASADLSPTSIAAADFISTRHLHGLFQEQGTSVSAWIRIRRLERCRRRPRQSGVRRSTRPRPSPHDGVSSMPRTSVVLSKRLTRSPPASSAPRTDRPLTGGARRLTDGGRTHYIPA